jgi:hypothetical protein
VCEGTFALCTVALCNPIPGNDKQVTCHCTVNRGYSAGMQDCSGVVETPKGQQIQSRYVVCKQRQAVGGMRRQALHDRQEQPGSGGLRLRPRKGSRPLRRHRQRIFAGDLLERHRVLGNGTANRADHRSAQKVKVLPSFPLQVLNK